MAKVHIGNLVEVRNWVVPKNDPYDKGTWETEYRFQNVNTTANISYSGANYKFLSFIYNGATRTRTGDNIEASMLVTKNQISIDIAYKIVQKADHSKKQIVVRTCLMNDNFTAVQRVLTEERWIGASMGYDAEVVEIQLASAVDAVFAGLPNMYLDETKVGRLPTTARVRTS